MTEAERIARLARAVADRVTDDMLTKPTGELTDAEHAILDVALRGMYADEIMARIDALNQGAK